MRAQPNVRIFIIREKVICKEKLGLGQNSTYVGTTVEIPKSI
jgi:hypothetical protein